MQVVVPKAYDNTQKIITKRIDHIPKPSKTILLLTEKDKIKYIKTLERVVRGSQEYKDYIAYLKKEIDMTRCSFFVGINNKDSKRKVSIEIHHEPFTLFDITKIVLTKWLSQGKEINTMGIAEEIMKLHYQNKVGLIPLSATVHDLVHLGKLFIPLQDVKGRFIKFLEDYEEYIDDELSDKLQAKIKLSQEVEKSQQQDMSILEKKFIYIEVDGMRFPEL